MSVKSFLVYPNPGSKQAVKDEIEKHEGCDVLKADNADVLILVTDYPDKKEEDKVLEEIKHINGVDQLTMVAGYAGNS